MFDNVSRTKQFLQLIGIRENSPIDFPLVSPVKPFECVGTFREASAATELSFYRYTRWYNDNNEIISADGPVQLPVVLQILSVHLDLDVTSTPVKHHDETEIVRKIYEKWNLTRN
jgi:hypothetical protein